MNVIIAMSGGTGFIGKRLVIRHLELGHEVRLISRKNELTDYLSQAKLFNFDVSSVDTTILGDFFQDVDVFYHCAGEIKDEGKMYSVHVEGTKRLIDAARGRVTRWVQLSSVGVYGAPLGSHVTEIYPHKPVGVYEETKCLSDDLVLSAGKKLFFDYVFVQPSAVVAKDMPNQSVFQLIRAVRHKRFMFIGSQQSMVNYVHADNVAYALYLCGIKKEASKSTFIISEHMLLREMIKKISYLLGCNEPSYTIPVKVAYWIASAMRWSKHFPLTQSRVRALTSEVIYSSNKLEQKLAYKPVIPIEQAMEELVEEVEKVSV